MNVKDLMEELGYTPKKKSATDGGEYYSPCPICKEGDDRFSIWPEKANRNGEYKGGRFYCRVCGKSGDAIHFLSLVHGIGYKEACSQLRIEPTERSYHNKTIFKPKPIIAAEPSKIWKEKAKAFVDWSFEYLQGRKELILSLEDRGFSQQSIEQFRLGFCPETLFRERAVWGLPEEIKLNGKPRKVWLPKGFVIPTFSNGELVKVKIRRTEWKEGDKFPKYVEVSGQKQSPSIYGNSFLPCCLVVESEFDALLIQQEAGDLVYCVALGGSTKLLDQQTDFLLRTTPVILFCPDFDEAGKIAFDKWEKSFPGVELMPTPSEKSPGDYFKAGGNLREWIQGNIDDIKVKRTEMT